MEHSVHAVISETGKRPNISLIYLISAVILQPKIRKTALSITLSRDANVYIAIAFGVRQEKHEASVQENQLECGPNPERDGRPAEYRWCPLFNAAKFG